MSVRYLPSFYLFYSRTFSWRNCNQDENAAGGDAIEEILLPILKKLKNWKSTFSPSPLQFLILILMWWEIGENRNKLFCFCLFCLFCLWSHRREAHKYQLGELQSEASLSYLWLISNGGKTLLVTLIRRWITQWESNASRVKGRDF